MKDWNRTDKPLISDHVSRTEIRSLCYYFFLSHARFMHREKFRDACGGFLPTLLAATLCLWCSTGCSPADDSRKASASGSRSKSLQKKVRSADGATFWNDRVDSVPWSINIVQIDRVLSNLTYTTTLARNTIIGLGTLSSQIRSVPAKLGTPIAAVNGDFYVVDKGPYIGDPRGLQILNDELVSSPSDQATFWLNAAGNPRIGLVESKLRVTWPNGSSSAFNINEERSANEAVLYTPRLGASTKSSGGRELLLQFDSKEPVSILKAGVNYVAKISEIRDGGNSPLGPGQFVLSLGPKMAAKVQVETGAVIRLSTDFEPSLANVRTAISGGNIMIKDGQVQDLEVPVASAGSYKYRSVGERHPRTAIGFNKESIFLVQVDGRQEGLSVGMTLRELGEYMKSLGCDDAMNFDGGGSSTMWFGGQVVNSPCNGGERDIANALIVVKTPDR